MADKSTALVLTALSRAAANPQGMPLFARRNVAGLFVSTSGGRSAALRSKEDGYLHVVSTTQRGKATDEICAITEKGVAYLLSQVSPKQVLEDFIRALEAEQRQTSDLVSTAQQIRVTLESMKSTAERVLTEIHKAKSAGTPQSMANGVSSTNGQDRYAGALLALLQRWRESGASEDCPLPELFRQAQDQSPHLTTGLFHDALRHLHQQEKLYLHPWTGPLYALPEPAYALLVGHEIAYYASIR